MKVTEFIGWKNSTYYKIEVSNKGKTILVLQDFPENKMKELTYRQGREEVVPAYADTWLPLLERVEGYKRVIVVSTHSWKKTDLGVRTKNIIRDLKQQKIRIDGIFLAGAKSAQLLKGITPTKPEICVERVWRWNNYPVVVAYDMNELNKFTNTCFLIGHNLRALVNLREEKSTITIKTEMPEIQVVNNLDDFHRMMEELIVQKEVSIDTETTSLARINNTLLTIQFAYGPNGKETVWILPWKHRECTWSVNDYATMRDALADYFQTSKSLHIMVRAQFDLVQLRGALNLKHYNPDVYDIQAGFFLLDENRKFRKDVYDHKIPGYSLDQLALECGYFGFIEDDEGMKKSERANMGAIPLSRIIPYGAKDVVVPLRIYRAQRKLFKRLPGHEKCYRILRHQFSAIFHAFAIMEYNGLPVDTVYLMDQSSKDGTLSKIIYEKKKAIENSKEARKAQKVLSKLKTGVSNGLFGSTGVEFDIAKPDAAQALFVDVLKLDPVGGFRKDGRPKLNKKWKDYHKNNPLVKDYLDWGEARKLYTTYIVGFLEKATTDPDMVDKRLRAQFEILPVVTSRGSARSPSLQQIPSRSELAPGIKRQFIALYGYGFAEQDYSSHEVLNWAVSAHDRNLAAAYNYGLAKRIKYRLMKEIEYEMEQKKGKWELIIPKKWDEIFTAADLHRQNCKRFFGTDPIKVTKDERNRVKAVVFGVIYDLHYTTLARRLGFVTQEMVDNKDWDAIRAGEDQALQLVESMFEAFPEGKEWLDKVHEIGRENMIVNSMIGQPRHLWAHMAISPFVRSKADRKSANSCIQGVSSHEGFLGNRNAQNMAWEYFNSQNLPLDLKLCLAVHDSSYSIRPLHQEPICLYIMEHAFTTLVMDEYRREYGVEWPTSPQIEAAIGGSLAATTTWDMRYDSLPMIIEKTMDWQEENLKYKYDRSTRKKILRAVKMNASIIKDLRNSELREWSEDNMIVMPKITKKFARTAGLIYDI